MTRRMLLNGVALAGLSLGATAQAQPVAAPAPTAVPDQEAGRPATELDDIIVTAQRRAENLQRVPLAVTAINAAQIEAKYSRDISELASIAPNVIIDPIYGVASAAISIRGLQLNDGEKSFDPAVAVYLDGIYLATTTGALLNVFDAASVEVLRGPQGTLFGRNTIGGLLQIRRNEPTGELGGKVIATLGSFEQVDVKGVVNLPSFANGVVSTKFAVTSLNGGGYFYNTTRRTHEGQNDLMMYSASVKIEPSPSAKLVINYDYIDDKSPTRPVTAPTAPGELFCTGGIPGCGRPVTDSDYHRQTVTAIYQPQYSRTHSLIANGSIEVAPNHEIVGVVGYRTSNEDSLEKFDGVQPDLFYTVRPQQSNQFSAELRYQGDIGRAKVVAGGYYFHSYYAMQQQTVFFGGEVPGYQASQKTKSYAAFGQIDWEPIDRLTVTVGGRYSEETKSMCNGGALGKGSARTLVYAFGDCSDAIRNSGLYSDTAVNPVTGQTSIQTGRAKFTSFTPKLGLSYQLDDALFYATYSRGFRSGGFNGRASDAFSLGPYRPEKVTNYEIGAKTQWFDNRLQINLAAFQLDYDDKQEDVVFPDPVAITVTVVQNAAKARIRGLEGEIKALPAEGLTLGLNFGYLDAKYSSWLVPGFNLDPATSAAQPLVTIDKSAFKLRRAPKWNFALNANYEHKLGNNAMLVLAADYAWKDDYYIIGNTVQATTPNLGLVKSFGLLNGSITLRRPNWQISVFGKNLTNTDYFQHALDVGTTYGGTPTNRTPVPIPGLWSYATIAAPRTFGAEFQVKF